MTGWDSGVAYDTFMGRWSRLVARQFITALDMAPGLRWLDVGCGTGALTETILDTADARSVHGIDLSSAFIELAEERLAGRAHFHVASGAATPFEDGDFDVVVSGLALNFMPDAQGALVEWRRIVRPGGVVGVYVWDYSGRMGFLRAFWEAVGKVSHETSAGGQTERNHICKPDRLHSAFEAAGLSGVNVGHIEIVTRFACFEDFWRPFLLGVGPAGSHVADLDEAARSRLATNLEQSLPKGPDGSIELPARAWMASGRH